MARTSVAFQSSSALENICTAFEFELTASSGPSPRGERTGRANKIETHGAYHD